MTTGTDTEPRPELPGATLRSAAWAPAARPRVAVLARLGDRWRRRGRIDREHAGAAERRLIAIGFVIYVGLTSTVLIAGGYFPSIDMLALFFLPIALVMRRGRTFLADWVPFAIVLLAYEQFRGLAHEWNGAVHISDVIAVERLIFGDPIPTIRLQRLLHEPGQINAIDVVTTALYFVHFVGVLALAFWLWLRASRRIYWRYVLAVLALSYLGFATYALLPTMPPRLATSVGALPPLTDVFARTVGEFILFRPFFSIYQWIDPNPYAAMPSLHIAYPTLVFLVVRRLYPGWRARLTMLYPLAMTFAVVYLGHHYVVDCVAGALYAWATLWLVWDAPRLFRRNDGRHSPPPTTALDRPEHARSGAADGPQG